MSGVEMDIDDVPAPPPAPTPVDEDEDVDVDIMSEGDGEDRVWEDGMGGLGRKGKGKEKVKGRGYTVGDVALAFRASQRHPRTHSNSSSRSRSTTPTPTPQIPIPPTLTLSPATSPAAVASPSPRKKMKFSPDLGDEDLILSPSARRPFLRSPSPLGSHVRRAKGKGKERERRGEASGMLEEQTGSEGEGGEEEEDKMPPKMRKRWIHRSAEVLRNGGVVGGSWEGDDGGEMDVDVVGEVEGMCFLDPHRICVNESLCRSHIRTFIHPNSKYKPKPESKPNATTTPPSIPRPHHYLIHPFPHIHIYAHTESIICGPATIIITIHIIR